jgi:hypothetical protein
MDDDSTRQSVLFSDLASKTCCRKFKVQLKEGELLQNQFGIRHSNRRPEVRSGQRKH